MFIDKYYQKIEPNKFNVLIYSIQYSPLEVTKYIINKFNLWKNRERLLDIANKTNNKLLKKYVKNRNS